MKLSVTLLWFFSLIFSVLASAEEKPLTSDDSVESSKISALDRRMKIELDTQNKIFVLTPHRPNYIMPVTYNEIPNNASFDTSTGAELDQYEVKFQCSMKFPVFEDLFGEQAILYFAYTNLSFWQAYNDNISSPFRETVHEPEVFLLFPVDKDYFGLRTRLIQFGLVHQSNGRSDSQSRSWNRFYMDLVFQHGDFYLSFKPWYRFPDSDDDNPDIENYLGHGELRAVYAGGKHTVSVMVRNNFHGPNYGALELNWSFPMGSRSKWFVQYFNGYGESLIDYNARVNRIGIGIAFTDWL